MKNLLIFRLILGLFLLLSTLAHAQVQTPPAQAGYWNVETNRTTRDHTIVRFYNAQDQLVYEERLDELNLDLRKGNRCCRRTTQQLNVALATVLRDPAAARSDAGLLAQQFGQDRRVQRVYAVR
ncbi:hypothetical protein ACVWYF_000525 [Hymenobacter sp. UYAg731]